MNMGSLSPWRPDGWSARTRLGVVVPHADVGPEAEIGAMAPASVSVHAARVHFAAMRAGGEMDPKIPHDPVLAFVEPPGVDDAVELLATSPLDVISLGFTSSAYKLGVAGEERLVERLANRSRGIPLVSTGGATAVALAELGVQRLALIHPPWFDEALDDLGRQYFVAQGLSVVHHSAAALPSGQPHITPKILFDYALSIAGKAEGVFIAGNGFRAVGIIEALEQALGVPVLSANQVLLWRCMRLLDNHSPVPGYGQLFSRSGIG